MASFGTEGKSPVMMSEDAMYDDGVVMEAVVEKFVKYFKSIFHHNSWYFAAFIFCKEKIFHKTKHQTFHFRRTSQLFLVVFSILRHEHFSQLQVRAVRLEGGGVLQTLPRGEE